MVKRTKRWGEDRHRDTKTKTHVSKFTHNLLKFYRKGQDRPLTGAKVSHPDLET